MTSRAWGHGAIQWTPSAVNAKVYVPSRAPPQRNVTVNTMATDEEGRCKSTTIELSNVEQESTIWSIKQMLGANELLSDVPPQRMSLSVYGAEAADGSRLREVSPTAHEVAMRLRVRRRGTAVPPPDALAAEGSGSERESGREIMFRMRIWCSIAVASFCASRRTCAGREVGKFLC